MHKITWVLVNCNSTREAKKIGSKVLKRRLVACFEIIPRLYAAYFWPPKSGKVEKAKGVILILETIIENYSKIKRTIKTLNSDKLPFVGSIQVNVSTEYFKWAKNEIKT